MEPGEKELREAFESTTTKNVTTVIDYSKETRKLTREVEEKVLRIEAELIENKKIISDLRLQLSTVQARVFSGGTI
jgi:hypothetical protein